MNWQRLYNYISVFNVKLWTYWSNGIYNEHPWYWTRILEGFTVDLILGEIFETEILPNSKKLWINMHCALLYLHFVMLLEGLTHSKFLRIK